MYWQLDVLRVRRVAKQDFLIPNAIRAKVLPPPGNSVKQMLEFTLPSYTISIGTRSPESFFSRNSPNTISDFSITQLRRLPTPAASVVGKFIESRRQAWLDGYQSVKYCHLHDSVATHFPLWLISFWAEALELRMSSRWSCLSLLVENCFRCRRFSMAKPRSHDSNWEIDR
jgi:hypothetical protein